jgi:hypothetical protein
MEIKIGRISLDDKAEAVRLHVLGSDVIELSWWLSVATCAAAVFAIFLLPSSSALTLFQLSAIALLVAIWVTGLVRGVHRGIGRSTCPRVRHLVEVSWKGHPEVACDTRPIGPPLIFTVDGISLAPRDFLGVVVAASLVILPPKNRGGPPRRARSSSVILVFRRALYELEDFAGADEAYAKELAERTASSIASGKGTPPRIPWDPTALTVTPSIVRWTLLLSTSVTLGMLFTTKTWSDGGNYLAASLLLANIALSFASSRAAARLTARHRSRAADALLVKATAALGQYHAGSEPFR